MIYELEVKMLPPAAYSGNSRVHWRDRYQAGVKYSQAVFYTAIDKRNRMLRSNVPFPVFNRPRLELTFVFSTERVRDADNLIVMFKPGLDALVKAEVLSGDDVNKLIIGAVSVVVDKERAPLTIVRLVE